MKNLVNYLQESFNDLMINESFSCSILNKINDTIENYRKIEKEHNKQVEEEAKKNNEKYYSWKLSDDYKYPLRTLIKDIPVAWSKIKDEDFEELTPEEARKQLKRMASNRSTHFNGIVIPLEEINGQDLYPFLFYTSYWGDLHYVSLFNNYGARYGRSSSLKPKDCEDFFGPRTKKVYLINITDKKELSTSDLKSKRTNDRSGVVYNTEDYYNNIAQRNKERYERLAAQIKTKKYADDGVSEKIDAYVRKAIQFSAIFSKDPVKYSAYSYDINSLIKLTSTTMANYGDYLQSKLSNASGRGQSWDRRGFENNKKVISEACKKIDSLIEKLEDKIGI